MISNVRNPDQNVHSLSGDIIFAKVDGIGRGIGSSIIMLVSVGANIASDFKSASDRCLRHFVLMINI